VTRKIVPEELILTLEDPRAATPLMEARKRIDALAERHGLVRAADSPFLTTRFLETREEEGRCVLFQLPLADGSPLDAKEIVKVPAHAALCTYHPGDSSGIGAAVRRILAHAGERGMNVGKSVSCVYWIDASMTPDESRHIAELRVPLKKKKALDSQAT
jgi:hypothetical protein